MPPTQPIRQGSRRARLQCRQLKLAWLEPVEEVTRARRVQIERFIPHGDQVAGHGRTVGQALAQRGEGDLGKPSGILKNSLREKLASQFTQNVRFGCGAEVARPEWVGIASPEWLPRPKRAVDPVIHRERRDRALANGDVVRENDERVTTTSRWSEPMATRSKFGRKVDDSGVVRDEWLKVLANLTAKVKTWAEELSWSTRTIAKKMKDSRLGEYEAPALLMQKETTRVLLDPIARFTPGADGVVDLYLLPAYDDIASLYLVDGEWRLHYMFSGSPTVATISETEPYPLSKDAIGRVLEEMSINASSAL